MKQRRADLPTVQLRLDIHTVLLLRDQTSFLKGIQGAQTVTSAGCGPIFADGEDHGKVGAVGVGGLFAYA